MVVSKNGVMLILNKNYLYDTYFQGLSIKKKKA